MAKLLMIDDEPSIRDLLEKLLHREGYEVVLAESGWMGLELFCQERPEVVVLDLKMSGIEGLTARQQVCRLNPDQRVIILTGAGTPEKEQEVRELGVTGYIEKGSSLHLIGDYVRRLLKIQIFLPRGWISKNASAVNKGFSQLMTFERFVML